MQSMLSQMNRWFQAAPGVLIPQRWLILVVFLSVTGVMIFGMLSRFSMDMSLESWFKDDDPATQSLHEFRRVFGSDDGVYLVYEAADGDVFSQASLATLSKLHDALDEARLVRKVDEASRPLTRIERIDSLINIRYQLADGDTLISRKLVGPTPPKDQQASDAIRQIALSQDGFELAYYSKDFRYGGIRLKTDFGTVPVANDETEASKSAGDLLGGDDFALDDNAFSLAEVHIEEPPDIQYQDMQMDEYLNFMEDLRKVTSQPEFNHFQFYFTGNAPMMEFAMNSMKQASFLLVLMVVIVVGLLWFLFQSASAVIWPIIVIAASGFWTIGFASWLGVTLSNMVTLTFMLILAVGIADCVHVLSTYNIYRREGFEHGEAMAKAYRKTGTALLLTSVTTMCGMSALTISDIPQIGIFGLTSALGVMVAFFMTIFVLPVMLDIWHPFNHKKDLKRQQNNKKHWLQPLLDRIPHSVGRRCKTIVLIYAAIFVAFTWGALNVRIDSNFAELTREGSVIRETYKVVDSQMMGGQNMEIMLDFQQRDALKDPEVLAVVDALQEHIEQTYSHYVVKTFSLADLVKDTNKVMHGGSAAYNKIPEDARLTAQLLYLFNNANPEDRRQLVSDSYAKSHISLQLRNAGSYEYSDFFAALTADIERYFAPLKQKYPDMEITGTGSLALMMLLIDYISWTQLESFSFALLIISVLMIITLGTVQGGLMSMVPNMLPAIFTFGLMGWLGIPLDTDTLIIAPLIIGIAVDDTIHFITHYRDAWFQTGDVETALKSTIKEVGQAVTFTTLILGVGFSMLAFSDYLGLAKTGIFGSMAIFVALSCDLLLLPALISWLKPDLGRRRFLAKQGAVTATMTSI